MRIVECMNYEDAFTKAFIADPAFVEKYHVRAGEGFETCVNDTIDVLKNCPTLKFYDVYNEDELIGFFGTEYFMYGNFLTTFFLYPQFRNNKTKKDFISLIFEFFGKEKELYTAVYSHNTRAVNFLEKYGFEVIEIGKNKGKEFLIFKHNKSCQ